MEPLANPEESRLVVFPIRYPDIWNMYKKMQAANWTAEEIDFSSDPDDYLQLTNNEKHFIKMILAFFAASDTIVNINLAENFTREIKVLEAVITYQFQIAMENVHAETYGKMIDNIIRDTTEKSKLFNAIQEFDCIKKKAQWAIKWIEAGMDKEKHISLGQRLIAFAIVEGIFFSGSFCAIFWFKKKNKMNGLCSSNELIARDESMHTEFACLLYNNHIENKVPQETVHDMFIEAVEIEREFICDSLPCNLLGMNSQLMYQYIKYVADRLLVSLNYDKIWNVENPFDFMESISMEGKTNFFEARPTQYQKSSILNSGKENSFEVTEDF
jgi:ribonucleoside-diphosphate reductase beta chain